jgi:DNA-binding SARP family transcriptional activator/tRNA A-37 threonylcarbamoyl transferase component Bud32
MTGQRTRGRIDVLGPLRAGRRGSEPARITNQRQARILAALVMSRNREATVDELIDRAFGDGDRPDNPEPSLRTYVNRLRKAIGDDDATLLATTPGGYRLEHVQIDADEFERWSGEAAAELDPHTALSLLDRALDLWSGRPYAGVDDAEWLSGEVARLTELRLAVVEQRLELLTDVGRHAVAIQESAALVDEFPFRERIRRVRSLALYRSGRQTDALRELAEHRTRMRDELGLEPDSTLSDLERRILNHDPTLDRDSAGGRRIRGYRLGPLAGVGAHSMVYRSQQPAMERQVAVKIIRRELANRPEFVRRFQSEARTAARLVHPHILPLFDFWREPDRACLVMPWMDGGTLESRLHDPATIDGETVLRQVASALAHAHAEGVTHNDVTARNVLLDRRGNAYLSDFGIAVAEPDREADIRAFAALAQRVIPGVDGRRFLPGTDGGAPPDLPNPYRGLDAFDIADAARFFGREAAVQRLADAVEQSSVTILVGPSGSGKSSVIGAGLVPVLEADGRLVTTMVPGVSPMKRLLQAVSALSTDADIDEAGIEQRGLPAVCARATGGAPSVVIIDQFEELFTTSDPVEATTLLRTIAGVEPGTGVRVLLAVRADFYGAALGTQQLATATANATVPLPLMTAAELTEAIVAPAEALGVAVDRDLVAPLIAETLDRPGGLPLLQFVLTQTWDRRTHPRRLTLDDYRTVGGVDGVISTVADDVLLRLDATARHGARRVFARLVHVGDEVTGRRAPLSELLELPDVDRQVIDAFVEARLLTTGHDPVTRAPTVELAHESLIDAWSTLTTWTDENRHHLEVLQRLRRDAVEWDAAQRDAELLWRGSRLAGAASLSDDPAIGLTAREDAFLAASVELEQIQRDAQQRAVRQATARRRVLVVLTLVGVVAVVAIGWAVRSQRQAAARQADADYATLVSNATSLIGRRNDVALLLAVEAYERDDGPESQRLLIEALTEFDEIADVWTEPEFEAGTAQGACVDIPEPGRMVIQPNRGPGPLDPTGDIVDIDLVDRTVSVVDDVPVACDVHAPPASAGVALRYAGMTSDAELVTVEPDGTVYGPFPQLTRPFWGPDGTLYARGGGPEQPGDFRSVDPRTGVASGEPVMTAVEARLSPDGTIMWAALDAVEVNGDRTDAQIALLDPGTFDVLVDLGTEPEPASAPTFSVDGSTFAYGDIMGDLVVVDVASGDRTALPLTDVDFTAVSPSGALVAVSTPVAGEIEVRALPDGRLVDTIIPTVRPAALEWLSEDRLAITRSTGVVDVVELGGSWYERGPACCPPNTIFALFSPDGVPEPFAYTARRDRTGMFDGYPSGATSTVNMAPFLYGEMSNELRLPDYSAMLIKQGATVLWVDRSGTLLDTTEPFGPDGLREGVLPERALVRPHDASKVIIYGVPFDERQPVESVPVVWVDTAERTVIEGPLDVQLDEPAANVRVQPGPVMITQAAAGTDRTRVTFREADGVPFADLAVPAPVGWVRLSADRRYVVASDVTDDTIRWFDLETGASQALSVNAGDQPPDMLDDGRFLIHTREGQFELWDGTVPVRIAVLADPGPSAFVNPSVSRDQSHVWSLLDGFWTKISLDPEVWVEQACALAGRSLTDEERADFAPGAQAPTTCPG